MTTFTISNAAIEEIQRIYRHSNCHDPVVRLREFADAQGLFGDLAEEVLRGESSEEILETIAKNRFEEVQNQLKPTLTVEARERARYTPEDLFEVSGITISMTPAARQILNGYSLIFENGRFLLRDINGSAYTLRDLVRKAVEQGH